MSRVFSSHKTNFSTLKVGSQLAQYGIHPPHSRLHLALQHSALLRAQNAHCNVHRGRGARAQLQPQHIWDPCGGHGFPTWHQLSPGNKTLYRWISVNNILSRSTTFILTSLFMVSFPLLLFCSWTSVSTGIWTNTGWCEVKSQINKRFNFQLLWSHLVEGRSSILKTTEITLAKISCLIVAGKKNA